MPNAERARLVRDLKGLIEAGGPSVDVLQRALAAVADPPADTTTTRIVARLQAACRNLRAEPLKARTKPGGDNDEAPDVHRTAALLAVEGALRLILRN